MDRASTGGNSWPLKSSSGENPTVTFGRPITFLFTDLPDRASTGPLANYLPGCFLTVEGQITQPAEGGQPIPRDVLPGLIFDSIDWTQSFFGTPLSTNNVKGKFFPVVEFTANGFKYGQLQQGDIPSTTGAHNFRMVVWVPAASDRRGRLVADTSQLALLFQPSQLKINFNSGDALAAYSPGATFTGTTTCRLTADLDARQELVLGTPMEWVLHEIAAAGSSVKIEGFGRNTALTGVEEKGGVAFLAELTSYANQDGIISPENISQISFQWRGQGELQDIPAWLYKFIGLLPNDRVQQGGNVVQADPATTLNDFAGYPHTMSADDGGRADLTNLRFFPWALGGNEVRLSDLQTADQDQTYYVTQAGGFSGTHQILAQYARQWQPGKRAAWEALVRASGLPQYCFGGPAAAAATMRQRLPLNKHYTTPDQYTYLAWTLQPPAQNGG